MATTPGTGRRDPRPDLASEPARGPALDPMLEPSGSIARPPTRSGGGDDLNPRDETEARRTGHAGPAAGSRSGSGSGFTTTFVIAAAVLAVAFLIALYLGRTDSNQADLATPGAPVAEGSATAGSDTTGNTTAPTQQTAPGTGDAGSGSGNGAGGATAPANP